MDTDLYRKQYDFELDQRAHLGSSVNIPITAATFLFGSVVALTMSHRHAVDALSVTFGALVGLALVFLALAIYFIFRSLLGYTYEKLQPLSLLRAHHGQLVVWHQSNGSTEEAANADFDAFLRERISDAADRNDANNIARSDYVYRATFSISLGAIFICSSSLFFLHQSLDSRVEPTQVRVVGDVHVVKGVKEKE